MKLMFLLKLFCLLSLTNAQTNNVKLLTVTKCTGTMCPAGCCPFVGWYCCRDNKYCASSASNCPSVTTKEKLVKMAAMKTPEDEDDSAQCEGCCCPGGCCPQVGCYCCPDNMYCAQTSADCPFVDKLEKWMGMDDDTKCYGAPACYVS
eukprot:GFUD01016168.1.p1 GENE.GFUD01016168.1~~GFUD01016168.1.p1  ORF type:complete len:148 (+),score=23.10 GFUD01016168.1:21-464(+)